MLGETLRSGNPMITAARLYAGALVQSLENRKLLSAVHPIDVNLATDGGGGAFAIDFKGAYYFSGSDHRIGGLYKTDGTSAGTTVVKDHLSFDEDFVETDDNMFFIANDGVHGYELWVSDGTPNGTLQLTHSPTPPTAFEGPERIAAGAHLLYFRNGDNQLWVTDGSLAGTKLVTSVPGLIDSIMVLRDGTAFFLLNSSGHENLWRSDGTAANTAVVAPDVSNLPIEFNGQAYFADASSNLLSCSDTGPAIIVSSFASLQASFLKPVIAFGNKLILQGATGGNTMLWATDLAGEAATTAFASFSGNPRYLEVAGNTLYFAASQNATWRLFASDATPAGTIVVMNLSQQHYDSFYSSATVQGNGDLYFTAKNEQGNAMELWRTNGTAQGTQFVVELMRANAGNDANLPIQLGHANGEIVFWAFRNDTGLEPWITDGTEAGSHLIKDINTATASSYAQIVNTVNNRIIFEAQDISRVSSLFSYDAATETVVPLGDVHISSILAQGQYGTVIDGYLYFGGFSNGRNKIFRTDGTPQGTSVVSLDPYSFGDGAVFKGRLYFTDGGNLDALDPATNAIEIIFAHPSSGLLVVGDRLYFTTYDTPGNGGAIAFTDGTTQGTRLVTEFSKGVYPGNLAAVGNTLLFTTSESGGQTLYRSDGTAAGTFALHAASFPQFTTIGSVAYFAAPDGLWKTDGTPAGTTRVSNVQVALPQMVALHKTLYFAGVDGSAAPALWRSDGTAAGTQRVTNLTPYGLQSVSDKLFFSADDGTHGQELWQSDGTARGTMMIDDLNPGPDGSVPGPVVLAGKRLYFSALIPDIGQELAWTDASAPLSGPPLWKPLAPVSIKNTIDATVLDDSSSSPFALFDSSASDGVRLS
ncbi:MAG TPA: ELWxxDGT repeat protein [Tepidisphaeraceae bacterium]|jgi:ELWxxDGT repeat protein